MAMLLRPAVIALVFCGVRASVAVPTAGTSGTLVVCAEEASSLADLDAEEQQDSSGSDAFVAIFVDGGRADHSDGFYATARIGDSAHPVWNECFMMQGEHTADTTVSFVVLVRARR